MTKKRSKALIIIVAVVLVLAVIGTIITVFIIKNNSKKDFLPFELNSQSIKQIELYSFDGYDVQNNRRLNEVTVTLNDKDKNQAIKDLSKLSKTTKTTGIVSDERPKKACLIVYTDEGKVTFIPTSENSENVYVSFSVVEFYNKLKNPQNENRLTTEKIGKNISKNSFLNESTMFKIIEEYKNGTRK